MAIDPSNLRGNAFRYKEMNMKMSSAKWRPFGIGLHWDPHGHVTSNGDVTSEDECHSHSHLSRKQNVTIFGFRCVLSTSPLRLPDIIQMIGEFQLRSALPNKMSVSHNCYTPVFKHVTIFIIPSHGRHCFRWGGRRNRNILSLFEFQMLRL